MANQTLEKTTVLEKQTKLRTCPECDREYNQQVRREQVKNYSNPNTAEDYCTDSCWAIGTSLEETA